VVVSSNLFWQQVRFFIEGTTKFKSIHRYVYADINKS